MAQAVVLFCSELAVTASVIMPFNHSCHIACFWGVIYYY